VSVQIEALHHWKEASGSVSFLKHPHRHIFHVRAHIEQKSTRRDVEYLGAKRELQSFLLSKAMTNSIRNFNKASCEDIAEEILLWLRQQYPNRCLKVEVFEDGENGCLVELLK